MRDYRTTFALLAASCLVAMMLAACNGPAQNAAVSGPAPATPDNESAEISSAAQSSGVIRQTFNPAPPSSTSAAPSTIPVIATRLGSGGFEVDLIRASVTGDVLTVELRQRNVGGQHHTTSFPVEQVSMIDDATSRRHGVLRDQSGQYMAAPLNNVIRGSEDEILLNTSPGSFDVLWFKFPAPTAESQTVSISVPHAAPFDGIRIAR